MRWKKLGMVYCPDGTLPWAKTHAMVPTPTILNESTIRIYVTFCDSQGIGRPGFVDLSRSNPCTVLGVSNRPLFDIGVPGTFDENGVLVCSATILKNGRVFLYYVGFELGTKIRYRLLTGLAVSEDGGNTFKKFSPVPVLERTASELFFRCGPYCQYENEVFRLWYVAGSEWTDLDGKQMPVYDIRYAESQDGVNWPDTGEVQISVTGLDEHGFGRPCVIGDESSGYRMFYSIRRRSLAAYRLGYAESSDGRHWTRRDDKLNLDVTPGGFDSDAIMYAAPLEIDGKLYIFYNGNEFGRHGFAVAVLEEE